MKNSNIKLLSRLIYADLCMQMEQNVKLDLLNDYVTEGMLSKVNNFKQQEEVRPEKWTNTLQAIRDYSYNEKMKKACR